MDFTSKAKECHNGCWESDWPKVTQKGFMPKAGLDLTVFWFLTWCLKPKYQCITYIKIFIKNLVKDKKNKSFGLKEVENMQSNFYRIEELSWKWVKKEPAMKCI